MPTQVQNRQAALDQLNSLGSAKTDFKTGDELSGAENSIGAFIERVKANIQAENMVLTGGIEDIRLQKVGKTIEIRGNKYLLYQDKGVKGATSSEKAPNSPFKYSKKMPPLDVFVEYIKRKNLNLREETKFFKDGSPFAEHTTEEKITALAYIIQLSVFQKGFKPRNIFSKEIPKLKEDLAKDIKNFAAYTIKEVLK